MDYLLKTEPTVYSFADLQREQSTIWDGVTNPVAVKHLREMKPETVSSSTKLGTTRVQWGLLAWFRSIRLTLKLRW